MWKGRIKVTNINTLSVFDDEPILHLEGKKVVAAGRMRSNRCKKKLEISMPFNHPRVLLADFVAASELLKFVFKRILGKNNLFAPVVIMHPMEEMDGGFTPIERRAFRELGLVAGARDVFLYEGEELTLNELKSGSFKTAEWDNR